MLARLPRSLGVHVQLLLVQTETFRSLTVVGFSLRRREGRERGREGGREGGRDRRNRQKKRERERERDRKREKRVGSKRNGTSKKSERLE